MSIAVDTSVLVAIAKGESEASDWIELLIDAQTEDELILCDVVAAEFFALLLDEEKFRDTLNRLGIVFRETSLESAQFAGRIFREYRRHGGPREHLIPDFLIAAYAEKQARGIAAIDRGYLRRYFPGLKILKPD